MHVCIYVWVNVNAGTLINNKVWDFNKLYDLHFWRCNLLILSILVLMLYTFLLLFAVTFHQTNSGLTREQSRVMKAAGSKNIKHDENKTG